jgi:hypothetical protein
MVGATVRPAKSRQRAWRAAVIERERAADGQLRPPRGALAPNFAQRSLALRPARSLLAI